MYKKLLLFFAVILPVVGMAQNYDFSVVAPSGQTLYYIVNIGDTSVTLISEFNGPPYYHSTSPAGDLTIPATVTHNQNTYTVTAIGNGAFHGCMDLTSVVIPESVTTIGLSAFYACTTLTALNIPSGVTAIEGSTFASCISLASVTLPDGITTIGNNAFSECRSLTSVNIPASVTSIGVTAFQGCSSLTSVTIPEGVTTIGFGVFNLCTSLATVTLPASLTSIGGAAFQNCSTLTSITCLAEAPPSIGMTPFANVPTGIPVYVPCGSVAAYQAASVWNSFTNIVGINCSTYSVLVYAVPEGYGLVGGTGDYTHGQTATLTATPNTGNHFVHWEEADTVYSRSADTLATILGDRLFTAVFAPDTYSVAVISVDTARGTAAVGIPGSTSSCLGWVEVGYGSTVDLVATPKQGYHFAYWHEDDSVYSHAADTTATVVGDRFILAVFEPDTHDIFVVSNDTSMGSAGVLVVTPGAPVATIEPFAEVEHGATISIAATPKPGYRFVRWEEDDSVYSHAADTTATVTADRFLVAIFAQDTHAWVDMGDGVLWATCNIGAVNPWDYGEYYAWGETQPKSEYSWNTYLWGDSVTFTRYTHPNDTLLPEDDAATANWGAEWRMPTLSEWYTLASSNHYSRTYVANYQGSGRRGIVVTRLSGRCRGNSIFLPYAGYKRNTDSHAPTIGAYFSNILSSERSAYGVVLDNSTGNSFIKRINWSRCVGASVRAVRQYPTYTVAAVSDNDTMGNVTGDGFFVHGETDSLTATSNPGYHFVEWREADTVYSRSADTVATINGDRTFTAVFAIDQHDYVEMGDGLRWATCNIGADNPWDYGDYYAWGETQPKNTYSWDTYSFSVNGSPTNFTRYTGSDYDTLLPEDDAATANWGGEWRMPTDAEWTALRNTTNYSWVMQNNYNGTGVKGMLVTRLTGSCAGNSIFLPLAGYWYDHLIGSCGYYWSSTIKEDVRRVWNIQIINVVERYASDRYYGLSVRAVRTSPMRTVAVVNGNATLGSVSGGGTSMSDTTYTITATPAEGYHFVCWMEADTVYSRTADTVVAATADRTLTAYFSINLYTVTAVSDNDTMGTVSAGGVDINETFDTYNVGDQIAADAAPDCRMQWTTWDFTPGGPDDGTVATLNGNKCAHFVRGNDQVLLFGDRTMGVYDFAFDMLVPNGKNGFFALVHNFDANSAHNAVQAYQHVTRTGNNRNSTPGHGSLDAAGTNRADIPCIYDAWMHFRIHVDIDDDSAEFYVTHPGQSETFVYKWQWSRYYGGTRSSSAFGGVDFYPPVDTATSEFYVDNITLSGPSDLQAVQHGDLRLLSATPNPGYHFVEWREADTVYSRSADTVITVTGDRSFTAVFAPDMADLVLTNVSYTRFSQNKLRVEYQFVNQGEVDYTETIGFTVYRNHYRGEVLGGGPRMIIDEDMLASSGNVATRSYIFYRAPICSLDPDDSLVIAINDMGFGVGHHAGAQPERDTLNNIAVLHINDVYPYRHAYSVDVQAACDSLTWIDDSTYRASTDTAFITVVQNYNSTPCDSIVRLDLTINHSTTGDTSAVVCDSMQWYGETYTASAEPTQIFEAASAAGCDSTVTLHLTVNYSNAGDTTAIACDSLTWYGETFTTGTDTASHTSVTAAGCDSTVTLHLTVNHSNTGDTAATVCDSLTWYGVTYTGSTGTASHTFVNVAGCDSTVTLHLTVNYSTTGDTAATVCDSISWYGTTYTAAATPTHLFTNVVGCDSTLTLHLTVNRSNTGDTTAVECDQFGWYEHTGLTASTDTLKHLFASANQWGCDSTVTLHLTINYQNTGDTSAVECDRFGWYEHDSLTASIDTLTHLFEGANQWGCDSTVTLHLTINYQNMGDTSAVECDQFSWYEHDSLTASIDTLTHLFIGGNRWGCDSTVTLHLTVNYKNTGDTSAVECDQFSWYEHTDLTASIDTLTHLFAGGNQWGCDSTVTLHLTVNYQNTGDTSAVECDQFSWYEHHNLTTSINTLTHRFVGANQWNCDSTVTLDLIVNYSNMGDTNAVECDHFMWYGTDYTASGTPTHIFTNIDNCDSIVTLHLTVNYSSTGDTTVVECDQFTWYGTEYTASTEPTHLFTNQVNCDSTVTLHLTIHYQNTGDTTAVECDQFSWWEHTGLTASVDTLTHFFPSGNQWGCDSTLTLHLTVNYQNTGDTTAVECDQFSWWEHTGLTASVDTLTHLLVGGNRWGCDSTVTLHLTVNYQNTGDTAAVECDSFTWYEHQNLTTSISTLTHRFVGANQWGCDSTVTLDLTVNYSNTGDTIAVECDQFSWYEHQNLTASSNNLTHTHLAANQVNCDSTVTLHLTIHYQNTGDTNALTYEPYTWYEHQAMDVTQNVQHLFVGANRWGCDSTVTLHLRYALFATDWAGPTTVVYNSEQQSGLGATYVDDTGRTQQVTLTFTNGSEVITSPNYPVDAGVWNVVARPVLPVDSLYGATTTLTILPATVYVTGAEAYIAKVYDRNTTAVVTNAGTLNNIQGDDALTHTTAASFNDPSIGEGKTITLTYTLHGTPELLNNYVIDPASEVYTTVGAIVDTILPARPNAFDVAVYGYCVGTGAIGYHLSSGNPDQYKLEYADSRLADVDWTTATGANGTLVVDVPEGLPTGDYTVTVTFREQRFPWIESSPLTVTFHVDLPGSYVKPLFSNVIALIDTCQCFSDIQWYHRSGNNAEWQAIPGANGYYYREESGLTGEYFVSAKMSGMSTYTCPQSDFRNLVSDDVQDAKVIAYPNPSSAKVRIDVSGMDAESHVLRVMNTLGVELENRTFDGVSTVLDMSTWQRGSYIVSVDGMVVRVVRN